MHGITLDARDSIPHIGLCLRACTADAQCRVSDDQVCVFTDEGLGGCVSREMAEALKPAR